jgi:DNA helicase-2/ATP-dependent DNA helicase PcrA
MEFDKSNDDRRLGAFLEGIALVADVDTLNQDDHAVIIMTLHSAKGLEFPVVFMVGVEQGVFPGLLSMESEERMKRREGSAMWASPGPERSCI